MNRTSMLLLVAVLGMGSMLVGQLHRVNSEQAAKPAPASADMNELQQQVKKLQEMVPDQAAVMSHVGYHFGNLWFAIDQENWDLADFYLSETRSNIKWAVRTKPIRKDASGKEFELAPIAEALDNGQLTDLKKSIIGKDKATSVKLYRDALSICYACHKTSAKPYLRTQVPTAPEARVINFDPKATFPQ
jgi:hypothetical protein